MQMKKETENQLELKYSEFNMVQLFYYLGKKQSGYSHINSIKLTIAKFKIK